MRLPRTSTNRRDRGFLRLLSDVDAQAPLGLQFRGQRLTPGAQFDPNATSGATDPNGSLTLLEALQKQLGLKLEMGKRPLPVLVIDHVEDKPTEN